MVSRLVLGCGTVGQNIVEALADGPGSLLVVDDAENRIEALREEGVSATLGDPTDRETVRASADEPDMVVVADCDSETNRRATELAVELFPDAYVVSYLGRDYDSDQRERIVALADRVIDPNEAIVQQVLGVSLGEHADLTANLQRTLRSIDGTLAVFMHDNPDPDAIASAVALCRIAEEVGVDAVPCYFGEISHQENRAFVNLLELDLRNLEAGPELDLSEFGGIALVDHSRPGVNDQLPTDTVVDIVVDHHPPKEPVEAGFVDLRSDVGATSTLLSEHIQRLGIDLSESVATGLLYGIRVDTKDFSREVSTADFEAASFLLPHADVGTLERVESPSVSADTFETMARAIDNRRVEGTVLATCVGKLSDRDALAQAADQLLDMEGITTTLVYGFRDGTVFVSARARGTAIDLGETVRAAFGQIGSAGGHADMAGAQISLGLLGEVEKEEESSLTDIVSDVITDRFFETIQSSPETDSEYARGGEASFETTVVERED
ncbi:DHH family phosphoesterase [Halorussus sp. MSC15.2]|uniref:DHH family phosphoesterase n=1 Tax=Halorussus sp. MSC15.2 TaxID=2283638 RepID=UPI0013D3837D|nr:DHH family phosphoesterase [Halorussus sp. MSC15.2]NEU56675.1 bifunctional oligoribonuclease/PAP phosphatase NrnA [Halorussus sp. MSC15.2]